MKGKGTDFLIVMLFIYLRWFGFFFHVLIESFMFWNLQTHLMVQSLLSSSLDIPLESPSWITAIQQQGWRGQERRKSQLQQLFTRMDSQGVGDLLEECLRAVAATQGSTQPTEAERLNYCSCRGQTQDGAMRFIFTWVWQKVRLGLEIGRFCGGMTLA